MKDKREALMKQIANQVNKEGQEYGLEVVDVRIKRADLPKENLVKVYDRMRADRVREATELRAQGEAAKQSYPRQRRQGRDHHQGGCDPEIGSDPW